jgi:integrase
MEKRGYSSAYRRSARATLRRALRVAEQDGLLTRNVAAIAEGPHMDHKEGRTLTPEQARRFLEEVASHRLAAAYNVTLALGLRRGEVLGLSWGDIEPTVDGGVLTVRCQVVRDPDGFASREPEDQGQPAHAAHLAVAHGDHRAAPRSAAV